MKSTNFLIATIDRNFNLFKTDEQGSFQFIESIAEHIKRLEELSDGHHFFIDEAAFRSLGSKNFPLRFTRVFVNNKWDIKANVAYRVESMSDLDGIVASKDRFSPNTQIFFIGDAEFLTRAAKHARKLLLTVVDKEYGPDTPDQQFTKFPLEEMKSQFTKRIEIKPELLDQIKQYRKIVQQKVVSKTTIAPNGMRVIQQVEQPEQSTVDTILNTPDYMFYEYSK